MEINNILQSSGNTLIICRRDDLLEFAKICTTNLQASQTKEKETQELEQPISQKDAIKYLGKSRQTLISWRKKGVIEGHTLGGRVYYLRSELLAALYKRGA